MTDLKELITNDTFPERVEKRNGTYVGFDFTKVVAAIYKARDAYKKENHWDPILDAKLLDALIVIRKKLNNIDAKVVHIEKIQDIVVSSLALVGLNDLSDSYCEYRISKDVERTSFRKRTIKLIDNYLNKNDWQIKENANTSYSVQGLNLLTISTMNEIYWKDMVFKEKLSRLHDDGDLHIHDLYLLAPYTYYGKEVVTIKTNDEIRLISFEDLYDLINVEEKLVNKDDGVYLKIINDNSVKVLDKDGWTGIKRLVKKKKHRDMYYVSDYLGNSTIVTDNHPVITNNGEIMPPMLEANHDEIMKLNINYLLRSEKINYVDTIDLSKEIERIGWRFPLSVSSVDMENVVDTNDNRKILMSNEYTINNVITLDESFGYSIGAYLTYNYFSKKFPKFYTSPNHNLPISDSRMSRLDFLEKFVKVGDGFLRNGIITVIIDDDETGLYKVSSENIFFNFILEDIFSILDFDELKLPDDILKYNKEFLTGVVNGIFDFVPTKKIVNDDALFMIPSKTLIEQLRIILDILDVPVYDSGHNLEYTNDTIRDFSQEIFFTILTSVSLKPKKHSMDDSGWNKVSVPEKINIKDEYIYDITTESSTLIVNQVYSHNCVGWDLKALLEKGFSGVPYKIECSPPKHFDSACGQIVNFLYTLSGECAGATSFSNVDTLLSPFLANDGLLKDRNRLEQYMQKFIYNLGVDTRVGFQCLSDDSEILTETGWKHYNEMTIDDNIYTYNMKSNNIEIKQLYGINVYRYHGTMIRLYDDEMDQLVTPNHKVIFKDPRTNNYKLIEAGIIIAQTSSFTTLKVDNIDETPNPYDIDFSEYQVDRMAYEYDYEGIVWCPTTENGTVIARRNGKIFITGNSPFTNFTLDLQCPSHMEDEAVIMDGKYQNSTYGEYYEAINAFNDTFCDVMMKGDKNHKTFTFPIPTYCIDESFDWDNPNLEKLWIMTGKYGIPYFSNYIKTGFNKEDSRSMCCRLSLDLKEIRRKGGGLFGSDGLTGSIGVVTINLPRIGHISNGDRDLFYERLETNLIEAVNILSKKTDFVEKMTEKNLYPYSKVFLSDIKNKTGKYWYNHFMTIGIIGMHEACLNMFGEGIESEIGYEFALDVMKWLQKKIVSLQNEYGHLINLEATPAEGVSFKLAQKDRKKYPDMRCFKMEDKLFYTNSTQLPVNTKKDLWGALKHQEELQFLYTGGTVFHGYLGNTVNDPEVVKNVVKRVLTNYKIPYFSVTPTFSICQDHGYFSGNQPTCPVCNSKTLVYSRVVGYLRPVSGWNDSKQQEFGMRTTFENDISN